MMLRVLKNKDLPQAFLLAPLLLLLASLSGCGNDTSAARPTEPVAKPVKATQVVLTEVSRHDLNESFTLPGTLEAWEDLTLAAELAGPVVWTGAEEGDRLRQGQAILRIDSDTVQANLQRDRISFEVQDRELKRYQKLLDGQLISQQEFDRVRSQYEVTHTAMRQSELALAKSTLKSPVNGVLDRLLVDRGEYVAPGQPLAQVVRIDRLKVLVEVPEKDVGYLQPGQQVRVLPANLNGSAGAEILGKILHVGYQADPGSRTYRVKLAIDNSDGRLRPGMILRARFLRRAHPQVIAVPLFAVIDQAGEKIVYVAEQNTARRRPVKLGPVVGQKIIITAGLHPGEQLVTRGQQLLSDGARIEAQ